MIDLVDRERLLNNRVYSIKSGKPNYEKKKKNLVNDILTAPTVDTEQHAYWKPMNEHTVYCSHCKTILETDKLNFHRWKKQNKFCRNCGCKMDEVEE